MTFNYKAVQPVNLFITNAKAKYILNSSLFNLVCVKSIN